MDQKAKLNIGYIQDLINLNETEKFDVIAGFATIHFIVVFILFLLLRSTNVC